jgi:uncharacterized membrane protein
MSPESDSKPKNIFETQLKSYVEFEREFADVIVVLLTKHFGSVWFLNAALAVIILWVVVNLGWIPGILPFDPYPFEILLVSLSFVGILLAVLVLISQNRQGKRADIRQRMDFEINVRAEHEVTKILTMLDEIQVELGMAKKDKELEKMKERIDIAEIKEDVEEGMEEENSPPLIMPS